MAVTTPPNDIHEGRRKAFDLADGWAKQIATLASATIVLSATFIKDILPAGSDVEWTSALYASWICLLLSAVLGLVVQGALTSHLSRANQELDIYSPSIRFSALSQFASFILGIGLFALFASKNL